MKISVTDIKKLREETGAGVADCRITLEEAQGDLKRAKEILKARGIEKAAKKAQRVVGQGLIETYVHSGGTVASMVEVLCETDFVAKTDEFKKLTHELAMQVAAMDPADVDELMHQEYIRDGSLEIEDLVKETIAKVGENIKVARFIRFELGS